MKRVIKSASHIHKYSNFDINEVSTTRSGYDHRFEFNCSTCNTNYSGYLGNIDFPHSLKMQLSSVHPYDDADYVWAKLENGYIRYIKSGKTLSTSKVDKFPFDEDDPKFDFNDINNYIESIAYKIATVLDDYNQSIKPKMVHN